MGNMLPGNSFPQICVVSVNESVENARLSQEYGRSVHFSNAHFTSKVTGQREPLYWAPVCGTSERFSARMESSIRFSAPVLRINRPT